MPAEQQTFGIVGAGLAGAKAAETLREEGFDGRLVLLGAEPERPYERPPLSKDYLRGETDREAASVHAAGFYAELDSSPTSTTSEWSIPVTRRATIASSSAATPPRASSSRSGSARAAWWRA